MRSWHAKVADIHNPQTSRVKCHPLEKEITLKADAKPVFVRSGGIFWKIGSRRIINMSFLYIPTVSIVQKKIYL